jgi:predicted PurR-regulated permease PerM
MAQVPTVAAEPSRRAIDVAVRLVALALLMYWCFAILRPFLVPLVWGITLAVALLPVFVRVERLLGGRRKLAAGVFVLAGLAALLVPTALLSESLIDGVREVSHGIQEGSIHLPPAPEKVAHWPLVGGPIYEIWNLASTNLAALLDRFHGQVAALGLKLVALARQGVMAVIVTAFAIVVAAVLLVKREAAAAAAKGVGFALGGARGVEFVALARATIATVATGVVGVAAIQALLAGIGLAVAGVPGAGLWALVVLILAVAQLPPILVLGPAILYVFAHSQSTAAIVAFTVWSLFVSFADALLKPLLMGRGTEVPVVVILVGAIGGLMLHGLIGLFVGAVVFAIGYRVFADWVRFSTEAGEVLP